VISLLECLQQYIVGRFMSIFSLYYRANTMILVSEICIVGHLISSVIFYVHFWGNKKLLQNIFWIPICNLETQKLNYTEL